MTTYSTRFLVGTIEPFSPYIASDPVPTGFIWVIRNITFQQTGNFGGFLNIWMPDVSGSPETGTIVLSQELYGIFGHENLSYRQVLNAGEVIAFQGVSIISPVNVICSGYQLAAP